MRRLSAAVLSPRKSPVQARSAASVDAILEATIQVLLSAGKESLTTTAVAARAGVSVGTLYQYFPNKSALLQSVLRRHLNEVIDAVERICREQRNHPATKMAAALITGFLKAKMHEPKKSVALYSVSSDVDGATMAQQMGVRAHKAIAEMLSTACPPLTRDPLLVASMLQGAMNGIARKLLESGSPEEQFPVLQQELVLFAQVYLDSCSARMTPINKIY